MKRQLLTYAIAAAIAFSAIVACSKKDNTPEQLSLNNAQMNGPDDPSSIADCYRNFVNTLKNPPSGYIPGDAENAFTECANSFIDLGGGGGPRLFPPAPPFPTGQIDPYFVDPPVASNPYIDGERLICDFWGLPYGLQGKPANMSISKFSSITGNINFYNGIIANAIVGNINMPARDKVNIILNHVLNSPGIQYFGLDRDKFFQYLTNVAFKYNSKLSIRTQFADVLEMNNADFKSIFIEVTDRNYP